MAAGSQGWNYPLLAMINNVLFVTAVQPINVISEGFPHWDAAQVSVLCSRIMPRAMAGLAGDLVPCAEFRVGLGESPTNST